jgi:hypothetical protein
MNRMWNGEQPLWGGGYVYLDEAKLSTKENKNLKQLLRGKHKVLENLDKKEAKRLYGMLKHLNTETVFSALINILEDDEHKKIVDKYLDILPSFLEQVSKLSRQQDISQEVLRQGEEKFLLEISNTLDAAGYYPKAKGGKLDFQELQSFLNLYGEFRFERQGAPTEEVEKLDTYFSSGKINDLAHTTNLLKNIREFAEGEDVTGLLGKLL